jgi:glycosyltransferase involved in cell wall biosynthesis
VLVNAPTPARPRLLFISPRFLFPLDEGGKIRTSNILRQMKGSAFEITLASPAPAPDAHAAEIAGLCDHFLSWPALRPSLLKKAATLPGRLPISVATDRSARGKQLVARALADRPEVVVADFPHAGVLLPDRIDATGVIFTHNIEAEIYDRHAAVARFPWRALWRNEARKMHRFEAETLRRFDAVIAVSARDGEGLRRRYGLSRVEVIDTGVDLDFYPFSPPPAEPVLVFSGAMDSRSNIDGIEFLADEVWPLIAPTRPDARAVIVGRNPPPALVAKADKRGLPWRFTGFVDDIRPHIAAGQVSLIPLRVGSGTRIKAFEAMALGRPVVSTTLGVEGLDIVPGEHFLAADSSADFAAAILRLFNDPTLRERLAQAARSRLEERFSWARVARQFEAICLRAIRQRAG